MAESIQLIASIPANAGAMTALRKREIQNGGGNPNGPPPLSLLLLILAPLVAISIIGLLCKRRKNDG